MGMPLNRIPSGLLDFFGIKSGEWGPRELSQVLQGNMDLWRHYVAANAIDIDGTIAQVAGPLATGSTDRTITWNFPPGGAVPNPVPAGELWYFDSFTALAVLSATAGQRIDAFGIEFPQALPGQGFIVPTTPVQRVTSDAANVSAVVIGMLYPIWCKPATTVSLHFSGVLAAGGTLDARCWARLVRLRI
ncbi:MAG TPA: hypothetical protein VIV56_04175 [Gemmatimonadales bacterium]